MVRTIPLTKARINLGAVVKRVHLNKEYFILVKDGIPVAGLMDIDEFEDYLELNNSKARRDLERSTEEFRAGKGRPADEFLADLQRPKQKTTKQRASA